MAAEDEGDAGLTLDAFVERHSDPRPGRWLPGNGPIGGQLVSRVGSEVHTASLLATNFWRAWLASEQAEAILRRHGASAVGMAARRTVIVPRDHLNRFDLVVLDPGLPPGASPLAIDADMLPLPALAFGARRAAVDAPLPYLRGAEHLAAMEATDAGTQPFTLLLAPAPQVEPLHLPDPPLTVVDGAVAGHCSAGVVVEDLTRQGRFGVTTALHGLSGQGGAITVDGMAGTVIRTHPVTDSAFIEIANPGSAVIGTNGVMTGLAPRGQQQAHFIGAMSKRRTTRIVGWDPQVPTPSAHRQACLYTGRDAQPGDSGCALVTDDDWIVGFAFERTKPGQSPVQCSWIWADSVLSGLQVTLA